MGSAAPTTAPAAPAATPASAAQAALVAAVPTVAPARSLARTGTDPLGQFRLALSLVVVGLAVVAVGSARRPALVARWVRRRR